MGKVKIGNVIGPEGPEGKQGKSGTIKVGTVRTLQPGEAATVSNSGTAENAVLDFTIPRGDDGITDLVAEYKDAPEHTCTPTVAAPVVIKEIAGKTEQVVTTGAQLLDISGAKGGTNAGITVAVHSDGTYDFVGTATDRPINVWLAGSYNVSTPVLFYLDAGAYYIKDIVLFTGNKTVGGEISNEYSFTLAERTPVTGIRAKFATVGQTYNEKCYPMLSAGSTALPWEPYTGGKPGPNPEYPMPIQGVGDSGSLVVGSRGENLCNKYQAYAFSTGNVQIAQIERGIQVMNTTSVTYACAAINLKLKPRTTYTISGDIVYLEKKCGIGIRRSTDGGGSYIPQLFACTKITEVPVKGTSVTFTTDDNEYYAICLFCTWDTPSTGKAIYENIMLSEGNTRINYQPYHHTKTTIPLSSPLYSGDKICCVQPGESYVDENGNRAVEHRVLWGVRRTHGRAVFDGSADEGWNHESNWANNVYYNSGKLFKSERVEGDGTIAGVYSNFGVANSAVKISYDTRVTNGVAIGGGDSLYVFAGDICQKGDVLAWREYLSAHNLNVVYKLATPYFQPFHDQSPFHNLRSANDLTYIYTDDPLKPEITVDVAKQAAGGYLLEAYSNGIVGRSTAEDTASLETTIENYYALRRTGKVYQTKIYKFASNPTSAGEKLMDNAGLVCQPSTDTVEGQDDYADIPLFQWHNVNYIRDRYGNPHPTAIEGQPDYKTFGSVDVGVMQMSFYINIDTSNAAYDLWTISDMPHPEMGLVPYPGAVRADGTMAPYIIHSKYMSGYAADGLLRSQQGVKPEKWQSHNNMIDNYQKKGEGYWGAGAERNFFQMVFQIIKYATKNSQTVMYGCTTYSFQYSASVQRSDKQTYFPLTNAQAANIIVGAYVSVGYGSNNNGVVNVDRGVRTMHSYADNVKVLRIEDIDANNKAVYLDVADGFATTPIALTSTLNAPITISSMHWWSGTTDEVKGHHDGSIVSNTNGKYPYRMQGLEYAVGGYIVASDTVMDFKGDYSKDVYVAKKGQSHSNVDATIRSTYIKVGNVPAYTNGGDWWVGDVSVDLETGCWYPSVVGSSDAQGMGDRCYAGGAATSGTREYLQGGNLWNGSGAGSGFLNCWNGLSNAGWCFLSCD